MLERWFLSHPRAVGETYLEHMGAATRFALALLIAGLACLLHALVPALCVRTGSRAIERLHDKMVRNRRTTKTPSAPETPAQPWADYAI